MERRRFLTTTAAAVATALAAGCGTPDGGGGGYDVDEPDDGLADPAVGGDSADSAPTGPR